MGDLSPHFSRAEFACHHCGKVELDRTLVARCELLRAMVGKPMRIVSGYRCPEHNRAVGGAPRSYHRLGQAVDVEPGYCTWQQAKRAGFRGVGVRRGQVIHLDLRPTWLVFQDP